MWSSLHKELNFHPERSAINEITHVGADRVLIHAAHTADSKKCNQQWSDEKISQSKKKPSRLLILVEIMEFLLWSGAQWRREGKRDCGWWCNRNFSLNTPAAVWVCEKFFRKLWIFRRENSENFNCENIQAQSPSTCVCVRNLKITSSSNRFRLNCVEQRRKNKIKSKHRRIRLELASKLVPILCVSGWKPFEWLLCRECSRNGKHKVIDDEYVPVRAIQGHWLSWFNDSTK